MENYFKTSKNLKRGEKDLSVVSHRSNSVEPPSRIKTDEEQKHIEKKKVAYKNDVIALSDKLENIKNDNATINKNLSDQLSEIKKTIDGLKSDEEQTKTERLKIKLDNFINSYNENEISHSEELKNIKLELNKLNERICDVEECL